MSGAGRTAERRVGWRGSLDMTFDVQYREPGRNIAGSIYPDA